jgi:hypothetical protein
LPGERGSALPLHPSPRAAADLGQQAFQLGNDRVEGSADNRKGPSILIPRARIASNSNCCVDPSITRHGSRRNLDFKLLKFETWNAGRTDVFNSFQSSVTATETPQVRLLPR